VRNDKYRKAGFMHTPKSLFPKLTTFFEDYPTLCLAIYLALTGNWAFWSAFFKINGELSLHLLLFSISALTLTLLLPIFLVHFLRFKYIFKPVIIFILLMSATVAYFMNNYGIVIDVQMIHNTFETDSNEVQDLLNLKLFLYILFAGLFPAIFVSRLNFTYHPFSMQLLRNFVVISLAAIAIVGNFMIFSADYASLIRNHHEVRYLINPANYIYSTGKYLAETLHHSNGTITPIGLDARQVSQVYNRKNNVLVLVVGETARAQNFSLNGYSKPTNPMLAKEDIINYPNFHSCGTSTHVSLPCMFSHLDRSSFNEEDASYYENLTDVLKHAGINVLWRDNNSGCKGVCRNIQTEKMKHLHIDNVCNEHECYDEVLLDHLQQNIESTSSDMVIVLHQNGSHGPAYYLRYPDAFQKFKPVCATNELGSCDHASLLNTYDNTILYTDYFLSRVINMLKSKTDKLNTAMIYVSDHGESLGENNIYLHSMPYIVAPKEQTHVPYISWFSDDFLHAHDLNKDCIKQHASNPYSHDNLFHSVLGLMNVSSTIYQSNLDMYTSCKTNSIHS
jgi:lipid A ethanolaminephosphotransferase